ncbi:MAG: acyltransferase family protein [Pseudomonadota bacterium]
MADQKSSRLDIQFLRAFAVLIVMAYHFEVPGFGGGFVGVDIFFVISGYLIFGKIHAQLIQQNFSLRRFFEARVRRIFPALALVCAATALWGWYFVLPRDYVSFSRTVLAALCFVSNFSFNGAQGYFDAVSHAKPLLHTWSLSVEGQFYFFLPLLLMALFKLRGGGRVRLALGWAATASLIWMLWMAYKLPESGFYYVSARAWEFAAGAICVTLGVGQKKFAKPFLLLCTMVLATSVLLLDGDAPWPNAWSLFPVVAAAGFIYLAVHVQRNPIIAHPALQLTGDMSYSLYLWHWPLWVFAKQMYGDQIAITHKLVLLVLTFVFAYLSWRWVERPFRDRGLVTGRRLMAAVVIALLSAMTFLAVIVVSKGYPQRFPDYIARAGIQGLEKTPRGECFRHERNRHEADGQFCVYGASARLEDATAMLWGDSHANMYLTPLTNASKALGKTGLIATMMGCRAFIETDAIQYPDYPHCKDFNREVFAYLLAHPEIKTIVLGRIWSDSDESIARTVQLIRTLIEHGREVILIGPLPFPGVDVQVAWAMWQVQAGHAIDEVKMSAASREQMSLVKSKIERALAAEMASGRLLFLDATRRLCDAEFCYTVRDGLASFCDTSHLTEAFARSMEPDFRAVLARGKPEN